MKEEAVAVLDYPISISDSDYETERGKPMPNRVHGLVQSKISSILDTNYDDKYQIVSELSLDTTPPSVPDLCIYPQRSVDWRTTEAKESEVPLTTIEILSPSQSMNELIEKAEEIYFPLGVKSSWIVVPELKAIHILLPDQPNLYFASGQLHDPTTGIEFPVSKVFDRLV